MELVISSAMIFTDSETAAPSPAGIAVTLDGAAGGSGLSATGISDVVAPVRPVLLPDAGVRFASLPLPPMKICCRIVGDLLRLAVLDLIDEELRLSLPEPVVVENLDQFQQALHVGVRVHHDDLISLGHVDQDGIAATQRG